MFVSLSSVLTMKIRRCVHNSYSLTALKRVQNDILQFILTVIDFSRSSNSLSFLLTLFQFSIASLYASDDNSVVLSSCFCILFFNDFFLSFYNFLSSSIGALLSIFILSSTFYMKMTLNAKCIACLLLSNNSGYWFQAVYSLDSF